jgi:hypothetical protein
LPIDDEVAVAFNYQTTALISPELVLIDPQLRAMLQERWEADPQRFENPVPRPPAAYTPSVEADLRLEAPDMERGEAATANPGRRLLRVTQFWFSVALYSAIVVTGVLGGVYVSRLLF